METASVCVPPAGHQLPGFADIFDFDSGPAAKDSRQADMSELEMKRMKNREKQRRCRERKRQADNAFGTKLVGLEKQVEHAKAERGEKFNQVLVLKTRLAMASAELANLRMEAMQQQVGLQGMAGAAMQPCAHVPGNQADASSPSEATHGAQLRPPPSLSHQPKAASVPSQPPSHETGAVGTSRGGCSPSSSSSVFPTSYSYKHHKVLRASFLEKKGTYLEALNAYRAGVFRELGCHPDEVYWHLQSEVYPELTEHGAMSGRLDTPESVARFTAFWVAKLIEIASLSTVLKRLNQLQRGRADVCSAAATALPQGMPPSSGAPFEAGCPLSPPHNPGDPLFGSKDAGWGGALLMPEDTSPTVIDAVHSGLLPSLELPEPPELAPPSVRPTTSAPSAHALSAHPATDACHDAPMPRGGANDVGARTTHDAPHPAASDEPAFDAETPTVATAAPDVDLLVRNMHNTLMLEEPCGGAMQAPRSTADSWARLQRTVQRVFADLFARYVRWMHPRDVLQLCKRLRTNFGSDSHLAAFDGGTPEEFSAGRAFAMVFAAVGAVAGAVLQDLRITPYTPCVPDDIDAVRTQLEARIDACNFEWCLFYTSICIDATALIRSVSRNLSPASMGYAEFEHFNLSVWKLLDLSLEQKVAIADMWHKFRRQQEQCVSEFNAAARQLAQLLAAVELSGADLASVWRFADALHQRDTSRAADGSSDGDCMSQRSCSADSASCAHHAACGNAAQCEGLRRLCVGHAGGGCACSKSGWMHGVLAVCPEATSLAGRLLGSLKSAHERKNMLFLNFYCLLLDTLTREQHSAFAVGTMPYVADAYRLAGMAAADVCCQRVYGRAAICG